MTGGIEDRIVGCIVGGAIGDALGGPYEGQAGPVALRADAPWRLSDDTQLTLATCEAVIARAGVEAASIATRFAEWFRQGRVTGMGASTFKALQELAAGAHWALAGRKGERAAGNGAAMRVAPLAFLLDSCDPEDRVVLRDVARITHHNEEAYAGALAVVAAVEAVAAGGVHAAEDLPRRLVDLLPDTSVRDRMIRIAPLAPATPPFVVARELGCSGYVVESVPLAIHAVRRVGSAGFRQVVEGAVEAGGDTDTIASIAGQIAGAAVGFKDLPRALVDRLPDPSVVDTARRFAACVATPG